MADDRKDLAEELDTAKDVLNKMQTLVKNLSSDFDHATSTAKDFGDALQKSKKELSDIEKNMSGILNFTKSVEARTQTISDLQKLINSGLVKQKNVGEEIRENAELVRRANELGTREYIRKNDLTRAYNVLLDEESKIREEQSLFAEQMRRGEISSSQLIEMRILQSKDLVKIEEERLKYEVELNRLNGKHYAFLLDEEKSLGESLKLAQKTLSVEDARQAKLMTINALFVKTLSTNEDFIKLATLGTQLMKGGAYAYVAILELSLDRWIQIDRAAGDFRKTTGLLVTQTIQLRKAIEQANVSLSYAGVTLEKANEAAADLVKVFGTAALVSTDLVVNSAQLATNLGMSVSDIGEFNSKFLSAARMSGTTTDNIIHSASALSEMAGVAPKQVMEDMAKASKNTLMFLAKNPIELMRATVEARRLGTTVNSLAEAARAMLNYQDSMNSELEASALLNQNISFQLSRQLAWEGKIVESREVALDQIKAAGDFTRMSVYQQEALAKAARMTVEEVSKQLNQREMLAALQHSSNTEDRAQYNAYVKMNAKLKADDAASKDNLLGRGREMAKQMLMQAEMDKLANSLKAAWISIQDALLPIANAIMPPLLFGLRLAGQLIRFIATGVKMLFAPFQSFLSSIGTGNGRLGFMESIIGKIESWLATWVRWGKQFSDWLDKDTGLMKVISGLARTVVDCFSVMFSYLSPVGDVLGVIASGIGGMVKSISEFKIGSVSVGDIWHDVVKYLGAAVSLFATWKLLSMSVSGIWRIGGALTAGMSSFGKKIFDTTKGLLGMSSAAKTAAASASKAVPPAGASRGPSSISQFLSGIKWSDVGKMAAMMAILAGGLWVLGKALTTFNDVDWTSLTKAGLTLGGLIGAIKLISMVPIDTKGILSAAAAMVVMGGALWVLGEALNKFNTIEWSSLGKAATALGGLAVIGAIAGFLPPVEAGMLAVGGAAAMLGVGLLAAGAGFALFGKGIEFVGAGISKVIDSISTGIAKVISSISTGVTSAADALVKIVQPIKDLSELGVLKLTKVALGISSIAVSLKELSDAFSGTQVFRNLIALTNLSTRLDVIAGALSIIKQNSSIDFKITGIKDLQELMKGPIDVTSKVEAQVKVAVETVVVEIKNIDTLRDAVDKLSDAVSKMGAGSTVTPVVTNQPTANNSAVVAKIDELISLMRAGVKVDIDVMSFSKAAAAGGR